MQQDTRHDVVIVGGGFEGLFAARTLKNTPVRVKIGGQQNFYLFHPFKN